MSSSLNHLLPSSILARPAALQPAAAILCSLCLLLSQPLAAAWLRCGGVRHAASRCCSCRVCLTSCHWAAGAGSGWVLGRLALPAGARWLRCRACPQQRRLPHLISMTCSRAVCLSQHTRFQTDGHLGTVLGACCCPVPLHCGWPNLKGGRLEASCNAAAHQTLGNRGMHGPAQRASDAQHLHTVNAKQRNAQQTSRPTANQTHLNSACASRCEPPSAP